MVMNKAEEIIASIINHACECDGFKFSIHYDPRRFNKFIKCHCGWEKEIPFAEVMEENSLQLLDKFLGSIDTFNFHGFEKRILEIVKKKKEEEMQRKNLERHKSAIGSLEV